MCVMCCGSDAAVNSRQTSSFTIEIVRASDAAQSTDSCDIDQHVFPGHSRVTHDCYAVRSLARWRDVFSNKTDLDLIAVQIQPQLFRAGFGERMRSKYPNFYRIYYHFSAKHDDARSHASI